MTRQEAVEWLARQIAEETEARHELDGNIDQELDNFGDEVRKRACDIYQEAHPAEPESHEGPYCRECGEPCFIRRPEMTAHHFDAECPDNIDRDADADYVAIPEEED